jgi:hypothetical protein
MSELLACPKCGHKIDFKEVFSTDFDKAVANQTKDLQQQLDSINKLLDKYMNEANDSKIKALELESRLKSFDKEVDLKVYERTMLEVNRVKKKLALETDLKVREKVDTIRQLKEQLSIAQRKAEQGSMQQQGEVQEVYIEDFLRRTFPLDTISEVKKGVTGADVLQVVNTRTKINVGKIYYESKRTKTFNIAWVDKLKQDMLMNNADIGIIVSSARPSGKDTAVLLNGIWVCSVEEFKIISKLIRDHLIKLNEQMFFQESRQDKKELIYNYVTSNEFKMQMEAIIEGFSKLHEDLQAEKRAMQRIWKTREKHIQTIIDGTIGLYGSIKGLGGNAINTVQSLELESLK